MAKSVLGYNTVNDSLVAMRSASAPANLSIIQVYAPAHPRSDEETEDFCGQQLQDLIDSNLAMACWYSWVTSMRKLVKHDASGIKHDASGSAAAGASQLCAVTSLGDGDVIIVMAKINTSRIEWRMQREKRMKLKTGSWIFSRKWTDNRKNALL